MFTLSGAVYSNVVYSTLFRWLLNPSESRWFGDLLFSQNTKRKGGGAGKTIRLVSVYVCALMPLIYTFSHINYLIPVVGQPKGRSAKLAGGRALLMTMRRERETYWKARLWTEKCKRIRESSFFLTHCWTQPLMNTSSGIMWNNFFFPFPVFRLIIQMQREKEENNALQPRAWLICRINETTCFSREPPEKCSKFVVVAFACVTETCAFWLRFSASLSPIRGGVGCEGRGSLPMCLPGAGLIWPC